MSPSLALGAGVAVGLYLIVLVSVGYATRRRGARTGLGDFYLAGRNLGGFVLLLTLYATQYSGNTLLGYPGEAFRIGYAWVMSVGFMMAIIVVYLLFAPRLQRLAQRHAFVTPGDWITHRFRSPRLTLLANVLLVAAISNYLLAQLMAMGHVTEGLSGGAVPYWAGVVLLTLVVIVYETVGGMRAVAWTDCVQGIMLLVGLAGLLLAVVPTPGHLAELTAAVAAAAPEKAAVPSPEVSRNWLSTLLLIGFSGAVYPHAIQRIYAARDAATLKRAFSVMVFLPLVTTGVMFLVGILAIRDLPAAGDADQVMPALLTAWSTQSVLLYVLCVVVITAVVAAVMSTADSVLLSLSSILAKGRAGDHAAAGRSRGGADAGREAALLGGGRRAGRDRAVAPRDALGPDRDQDGDPGPGGAAVRAGRDMAAPDHYRGVRRDAGGVRHLRGPAPRGPAGGVERARGHRRARRQRGGLRGGDAPVRGGGSPAGRGRPAGERRAAGRDMM